MDSACDARRGVLGDLRMIRIRIVARERRPVGRRQRYRRRRNGYTGRRGDRGHWHGARGAARQAASRARRAGRRRPRASFRRRRGGRRRRAGARFLRTAGGKAAHPDRSSDDEHRQSDQKPSASRFCFHTAPPPLYSILNLISVADQLLRTYKLSSTIAAVRSLCSMPSLKVRSHFTADSAPFLVVSQHLLPFHATSNFFSKPFEAIVLSFLDLFNGLSTSFIAPLLHEIGFFVIRSRLFLKTRCRHDHPRIVMNPPLKEKIQTQRVETGNAIDKG